MKDRKTIDDGQMEEVEEVKGVFYNAGQYQIILGFGIVNKVYAELQALYSFNEASKDEIAKDEIAKDE